MAALGGRGGFLEGGLCRRASRSSRRSGALNFFGAMVSAQWETSKAFRVGFKRAPFTRLDGSCFNYVQGT
jgi:hypothetical protein